MRNVLNQNESEITRTGYQFCINNVLIVTTLCIDKKCSEKCWENVGQLLEKAFSMKIFISFKVDYCTMRILSHIHAQNFHCILRLRRWHETLLFSVEWWNTAQPLKTHY